MFYHSAWLSGNGKKRNVGVDRLYFNDSDPTHPLLPVAATPGWLRAAQGYLSPYDAPVPAFTIAQASKGVFTRPSGDGGEDSLAVRSHDDAKQLCIDGILDGGWTHTRQVDFGTPKTGAAASPPVALALALRVAVPPCSPGDCPRLTMHLGDVFSPAVLVCELGATTTAPTSTSTPTSNPASASRGQPLWSTAECPFDADGAAREREVT